MIGYLKAEGLKMKGSISIRLLLFIPLCFWLFAIYTALFVTKAGTFNAYIALIFNLWPLIFLPISQAIACSLNINLEKNSGNYISIISNNLSLSKMWCSKIINMVGYQFVSGMIVIIIAVGGSLLTFNDMPNIPNIAYTTLLITLAFLPLIPFNFMLSQYFGTIITVITNLIGIFISVVWLAPYSTFWLTPWGNILRIPAVTMGIHPNGTQLEAGSPLLDSSILGVNIISSIVYFVLFSGLFTFVFKKKVMK